MQKWNRVCHPPLLRRITFMEFIAAVAHMYPLLPRTSGGERHLGVQPGPGVRVGEGQGADQRPVHRQLQLPGGGEAVEGGEQAEVAEGGVAATVRAGIDGLVCTWRGCAHTAPCYPWPEVLAQTRLQTFTTHKL